MIKLILPAGEIPVGSVVTKKNGEKQYTLKDKIRIFDANQNTTTINASDGTKLLVADTGDANVIKDDVELVWEAEEYQVISYVENRIENRYWWNE